MAESKTRDFDIDEPIEVTSKYQARYTKSFALVIGIDSYDHLSPLEEAEKDAKNIADLLAGEPFLFDVKILLGKQATRQAIESALFNLCAESNPDDRVIFYFAGHGYPMRDIRDFEDYHLACVDTNPKNPFDGLEFEELKKLLRFSKAKHIAFILDACFSGSALGLTRSFIQDNPSDYKPEDLSRIYLRYKAYQALTAGAVEVVSDFQSMTKALIEVLEKGKTSFKDSTTFNELSEQIHDAIRQKSRGLQTPMYGPLSGSAQGQMVLFFPRKIIPGEQDDIFDQLPEDLDGLTDANPKMRYYAIAEAEDWLNDPTYGNSVRIALEVMRASDPAKKVQNRAAQALGITQKRQPIESAPKMTPKKGKISSVSPPKQEVKSEESPAEDANSLTDEGIWLYSQDKLGEAEENFRKAIEIDPDFADAHYNLGILLEDRDQPEEAEQAYQKTIEVDPNYTEAYFNLAVLREQYGQDDQAEQAYLQAIEVDPSYAAAHFNLGILLTEKEQFAEAKTAYRNAIKADPEDADAYINLGLLYAGDMQFDEAEEIYRKAIEANPYSAEAFGSLGWLLEDLGRVDEAEEAYLKAAELDPSLSIAHLNLGLLLENQDRNDEAEAAFRKAIEVNPEDPDAYINLGLLLEELDRTDEAINLYHEIIEYEPMNPIVQYNLGILMENEKRFEEAEAAYRNAMEADPEDPDAYSRLGTLLENQNRQQEAEALYRLAIEVGAGNADVYNNLGLLLYNLGRKAEAENLYQKAIEIDPNHARAYYNLGILLSNLGRNDEAESAYRQAIEADPEDQDTYHNLILLLRATGKYKAALDFGLRLVELNADLYYYFHLIGIYGKLGDKVNQNKYLAEARELVDENDPYGLACLESLAGNDEAALEQLSLAAMQPDFDFEWTWEDPNLEILRENPRFPEIAGPRSYKPASASAG